MSCHLSPRRRVHEPPMFGPVMRCRRESSAGWSNNHVFVIYFRNTKQATKQKEQMIVRPGWSNNHFNKLPFRVSLETKEIATCAAEQSWMLCVCCWNVGCWNDGKTQTWVLPVHVEVVGDEALVGVGLGRHHLSDATCPMRPRLFSTALLVWYG